MGLINLFYEKQSKIMIFSVVKAEEQTRRYKDEYEMSINHRDVILIE